MSWLCLEGNVEIQNCSKLIIERERENNMSPSKRQWALIPCNYLDLLFRISVFLLELSPLPLLLLCLCLLLYLDYCYIDI